MFSTVFDSLLHSSARALSLPPPPPSFYLSSPRAFFFYNEEPVSPLRLQ